MVIDHSGSPNRLDALQESGKRALGLDEHKRAPQGPQGVVEVGERLLQPPARTPARVELPFLLRAPYENRKHTPIPAG